MKAMSGAVFAAMIGSVLVQPISSEGAATFKEKVLYSFSGNVDGAQPYANVIKVKGMLYGTTFGGGNQFSGAVLAIDPNTGAEKVLYSFDGGDGYPEAGLI